jgi:hypothetical protein
MNLWVLKSNSHDCRVYTNLINSPYITKTLGWGSEYWAWSNEQPATSSKQTLVRALLWGTSCHGLNYLRTRLSNGPLLA